MANELEILNPDPLESCAEERLKNLQKAFLAIDTILKKSPAGKLYARKSNGTVQFFCKENGSAGEKYIHKKDFSFAQKLAQKRYLISSRELIKEQTSDLEFFLEKLKRCDVSKAFESLPDLIKPLVKPLTLSDEEYVKQWLSVEYSGNNIHEITSGFYTANGEKVRSKSEVIIADVLSRMNVPYRYEFAVELDRADGYGSYTAYPDFYCLNVRTRKEFVWEHFGLMDDADYAEKTVRKLQDFQKSGWFYGDNMIFTMETARQQLNTRNIELLVKKFLK